MARADDLGMLPLSLVFLSPLLAESLSGYDNTTGNPILLAFGLLFFAPLYGVPALLIRETARRLGLGWPSMVLLAAAFGIIEAGVIDQSMFMSSYRDVDYWDEIRMPTLIASLDVSAGMALSFVIGHVVWSFCVPIAMMESLSIRRRHTPWLRWPWWFVAAGLYLVSAWFINRDHLKTEADQATTAQWGIALAVATALIVVAVLLRYRRRRMATEMRIPRPLVLAGLSLVIALGYQALPENWTAFALRVGILVTAGWLLVRAARSRRWTQQHLAAAAAGPLLSAAMLAFLITPLGEVPALQKYGHNVVFLLGVALLLALAGRRAGRASRREPAERVVPGLD